MSKQNTQINPPSRNVADMLEILANPEQYRKHLDELKASHRELEERIGVYNTLEKVRAFEKQVKLDAADVAKSRKDAEALWAKVDQASKDVADRTKRLDEYKVSLDEAHAVRMAALAKDISAHLAEREQYATDQQALVDAQVKLRADHIKHDTRMAKANEKLATVVTAIKGVEAL